MELPGDHNFSRVPKKLFKETEKCSQGLGNGLPLCVCGCACKGECVWPVFVIMNSPPPFPEAPAVHSVCVFELLCALTAPHFPYLQGPSRFCRTNKERDKVRTALAMKAKWGFLERQWLKVIMKYYGVLLLGNSVPDSSTEVEEKRCGNLVKCQECIYLHTPSSLLSKQDDIL